MSKSTDSGANEFLLVQFDFLDPSSSDITVNVIFHLVVYLVVLFSSLPHKINEKAYIMEIHKQSGNLYASQIKRAKIIISP